MTISRQLKTISESYTNCTEQRMAIQLIPIVGGAIDSLMAGTGTQIQQDRFYALLDSLAKRLDKLEETEDIKPTEELFDLLRVATENSVRTRSESKRERFTNIIANKVVSDNNSWSEAEEAIRLIGELDDIHIEILLVAQQAPEIDEVVYDKQRIVSLTEHKPILDDGTIPLFIQTKLPKHTSFELKLAYIRLLSEGLVEPPTSLGGKIESRDRNDDFVLTPLGEWLLNWIANH